MLDARVVKELRYVVEVEIEWWYVVEAKTEVVVISTDEVVAISTDEVVAIAFPTTGYLEADARMGYCLEVVVN